MKEVSQDTLVSVKYQWQTPVWEAVREMNLDLQTQKIAVAETVIAERRKELANSETNLNEEFALNDSQDILDLFKASNARK